jgi:hypothetical protein
MKNINAGYLLRLGPVLLILVLSLGFICISLAASTTIQVQQMVIGEGNGKDGEGSAGGILLPINATPPQMFDIRITDVTQTSAKVSWRTDEICLVELYYGKTKSFESGPLYSHPESYAQVHEFELSDLQPGTRYYLKLISRNQKGAENIWTAESFLTAPEFLTVPDVGSLTAEQQGKVIMLDWRNPTEDRFRGVQINKKVGSPATGTEDGEKIFSGFMDHFIDANISDRTTYYYTVFSYDDRGKFSSGVVADVTTRFAPSETGTVPASPTKSELSDVFNLKAVADVPAKQIILSWQCPADLPDCSVEIRRGVSFPATTPTAGDEVYSGSEHLFRDSHIDDGQIYFYTVFVKSKTGEYSKGRVVASDLRETISEETVWRDIVFVDTNSGIILDSTGTSVSTMAGSILGINYSAPVLPNGLKGVRVRIGDLSYLLQYDERTQSYQANFIVPTIGEYPMTLDFVDAKDSVVFEREMQLDVLARGKIVTMQNEKLFASGLSWNVLFCRLGNLFGGYDESCMIKAGIEGAQVKVYKKGEGNIWQLWTPDGFRQSNPVLSDDKGRYGFFVPLGEYTVTVQKDGYQDARLNMNIRNNVLNPEVKLYGKYERRYGILIIVALLLLGLLWMRKRYLHIGKKMDKT